jgi:hypothetical protein
MLLKEATEEERGTWMKLMVVFIMAGVIIALAPEIMSWLTGVNFSNLGSSGLPTKVTDMMTNLLLLARVAGAVTAVGGAIVAVIKM